MDYGSNKINTTKDIGNEFDNYNEDDEDNINQKETIAK